MWSITVKRSRKLTICGVTLAVVLAFINAPTKAIAVESEPNPSEAEAAMVVDAQGDVLYEKNPDEEINMASAHQSDDRRRRPRKRSLSRYRLHPIRAITRRKRNGRRISDWRHLDASRPSSCRARCTRQTTARTRLPSHVAGSEQAFVQMMNDKGSRTGDEQHPLRELPRPRC